LSKATLEEAATFYLGSQSARDLRLSPLDDEITTMPPVRIHVGDAEVLLDDALRFTQKADQAGLNCETHVWEGMIHVFPSNFAMLEAAAAAVEDIGAFLADLLGSRQ
jgi:acetyl esterase/lipase